ncbi:hypothetical protein PUN28_006974 [Cardiocondyla obscurior]|uniref:Uncharacterized protein n=1 Tax=Cardiocondyla obscurior TaxID=286306 RepID=A0AAW2G2T8_9HYME
MKQQTSCIIPCLKILWIIFNYVPAKLDAKLLNSCFLHQAFCGVSEIPRSNLLLIDVIARLVLQKSLKICIIELKNDRRPLPKCFRPNSSSCSRIIRQIHAHKTVLIVIRSSAKKAAEGREREWMRVKIGRDRKRWKYSRECV